MIYFILRGLFRGFFKEIGSLAGVIIGIWLANAYQPHMTHFLGSFLPPSKYLPLISFAAIFTVIFVLCSLAGRGLKAAMEKVFFGWADRTLGAGLAVIKGVIIAYFAIVLLTIYVPSKAHLIPGSTLAPLVITSYQSVVGMISPGSYRGLKRKFLETKQGILNVVPEKTKPLPRKDGSQ
ncbi:MAG: CvpA family protein [Deltaproteobacteria bacterium]|nr:CvpA family protein [Deltaproteobacteria bacterium]